jgi:hypothetical protein
LREFKYFLPARLFKTILYPQGKLFSKTNNYYITLLLLLINFI